MASAASLPTQAPHLNPRSRGLEPTVADQISGRTHLFGILLLSLPFLGLGLLMNNLLFLSDSRAQIVARALIAIDRGRLELSGLSYPPLPSILTLLRPDPSTLAIAAALSAGAIVWILWTQLCQTRLSLVTRIVLLAGFGLAPSTAFLATQSFSEIFALLLFLVAWYSFLQFTLSGETWGGFAAGLVLGLGFYINLYAALYGLMYALASPFFQRWSKDDSPKLRRQGALSGILIIIFPVGMALLTWIYLNWIFSGDGLHFLTDTPIPLFAYLNGDTASLGGLGHALTVTLSELLQSPIYLLMGLISVIYSRRRLPTFLLPIVLITIVRALGFSYSAPFALCTYTVVALAAIPSMLSRHWEVVLILVMVLNVAIGVVTPNASPIMSQWQQVVNNGKPSSADEQEAKVTQALRQAPAHSILADDRSAYRLIARTGSATPFILPVDSDFALAIATPGHHASYLLMPTASLTDAVSGHFGLHVPLGFVLDSAWTGWQLYRRTSVPPLVGK
ncbi:MAG: hypothetical protein ABI947_23630 [Chloroflexota bacterium]